MSAHFEQFKTLHHSGNLFILPNAWDAKSAQVLQANTFPAVATSSMAVAGSLGYNDGEDMPFSDYLFVINRILSAINIPLSVDMEMGYGSSDEKILENVLRVARLGVAGINIEDSTIVQSKRVLKDAVFARTIEYIRKGLSSEKLELFINVRCDTYIADIEDRQTETARRLKLYEDSGADGIFLPFITLPEDIAAAVDNTRLPLNVMSFPGLPDLDRLHQLGVKRVSMGPWLFTKTYTSADTISQAIITQQSLAPLL
ncbi:isocitrate lyase/phosphoenolpyruvate mutase family protein [Chitinophaga sp. 212800010-3]|uniref:isocitrate lyase/PEP mutase family protein n=1 Tax=unclassified Chitinophaga TaxID=2619133 RepID=UPI002DEF0EE8|nr:Carboxyvinyl-carboxyphosphonate phosphorylmutase [Chitinophaga sp. 212800010-3]